MSTPAISALDRVTNEIRRRLQSGLYSPGSDLPASAALGQELGVSPGTVRKALARLDEEGLTITRRGRPRVARLSSGEAQATRYEAVAAAVRGAIAAGELATGSRLPSEAALAAQYRVSRDTVRRALRLLEAEGAVVQRAGRRYVAGTAKTPDLAYERVADAIRRQILRTRSATGEQLAGEQQLAADYGVSRPTVRKALELLREEGLVYSEPKRGWFTVPTSRRSSRHG